jgi:hypothetical protein
MNPSSESLGVAVLALGTLDPPEHRTPVHDIGYSIAFDAGELLEAFATNFTVTAICTTVVAVG